MFSITFCTQNTSPSPTAAHQISLLSSMSMRTGEAIATIENQSLVTLFSLMVVLSHGSLTNNNRSQHPRWKANICHSRTHQEKLSPAFHSSTTSPAHLSSSATVKPPSLSFNVLFDTIDQNTSTFDISSFVIVLKMIKSSSTTSPQKVSLRMFSPRPFRLPPLRHQRCIVGMNVK
jgi:hypothetical protein